LKKDLGFIKGRDGENYIKLYKKCWLLKIVLDKYIELRMLGRLGM
jgi:hypothetical protein